MLCLLPNGWLVGEGGGKALRPYRLHKVNLFIRFTMHIQKLQSRYHIIARESRLRKFSSILLAYFLYKLMQVKYSAYKLILSQSSDGENSSASSKDWHVTN